MTTPAGGNSSRQEDEALGQVIQDFHPDLRRIARLLPRSAVTRRTLPLMQVLSRMMAGRKRKGVEMLRLPGGIDLRVHRPAEARGCGAAMLWLHGGGYVVGSATQDDALCARLARRLGIPVFAPDYRLAPQNPYPAALEDCYATLRGLSCLDGLNPDRIILAGASAGGGLAAALALLARDRGEVAPMFQLLVYPMLDDRSSVRAGSANAMYRLWTEQSNRLGWEAYLGGADPQRAVPGRQRDLSRLPPAWIGVGTLDLLHDEDVDYARRLIAAGVPCTLEVVPGAFHGFDVVAPRAGVSRGFFNRQCEAMEAVLDTA